MSLEIAPGLPRHIYEKGNNRIGWIPDGGAQKVAGSLQLRIDNEASRRHGRHQPVNETPPCLIHGVNFDRWRFINQIAKTPANGLGEIYFHPHVLLRWDFADFVDEKRPGCNMLR